MGGTKVWLSTPLRVAYAANGSLADFVFSVSAFAPDANLQLELTALGLAGWELVGLIPTTVVPGYTQAFKAVLGKPVPLP